MLINGTRLGFTGWRKEAYAVFKPVWATSFYSIMFTFLLGQPLKDTL
jgi:hypothetical protein